MKHPYYAFHIHVDAYSRQSLLRLHLEVGVTSQRSISLLQPLRLACGPVHTRHTDLIWTVLSSASTAAILL